LLFRKALRLRVLAITLIVAAFAEMINISAAITAVTKILTGVYAARRNGVDRRGQLHAGTALIARGEFSIVVVGLVGSAVEPRLGVLVAAYVLILATAGPIITRFAEGPQRHPEVHEPRLRRPREPLSTRLRRRSRSSA